MEENGYFPVGSYFHALSESIFMDKAFRRCSWVAATNIYEVNLRQYTSEGTIRAFMSHLPRLQDMGVETLWLMPVTPISQKNRKGSLGSYYAASDYMSVNPEFGNLDDFCALVQDAHARGMKIIIDWVANHTGWDHVWTQQHPEFYTRDEHGNFKPPFPDWEDVIHLNYQEPTLWKAMIAAMRFWVDKCDIDGFRCDMAMLVTRDFWTEARKQLDVVKPLFWYGEFDQWDNPDYAYIFDASYSWRWMHATAEFYRHHRNIAALDNVLAHYDHFGPHEHIRSFFTSNHDENSWNGTEYEKYVEMAKPLAVFSCTWNGMPLIYSGQELPNYQRLPFFDKGAISWADECKLHLFYKTLLQLRKNNAALQAGDSSVHTIRLGNNADHEVFAFVRKHAMGELLVVLNFSPYPHHINLFDDRVQGDFTNVFTQETLHLNVERHIALEAWGFRVFSK